MTKHNSSDSQHTSTPGRGPRKWHESPAVENAKDILRGKSATPKDMLDLSKELKGEKKFGYARKILYRARSMPVDNPERRLKLGQQHALCTYKDPDLPAASRFEWALEILQECDELSTTTNQETLGLTGAVFKRKWEMDGRKADLERSLFYYRRGYEQGPESDQGYTGINAAFVLDVLASLEEREAKTAGTASKVAGARRNDARQIREALVTTLPPLLEKPDSGWLNAWWFYVTVAEAHFGLGQYEEASDWLKRGAALGKIPDWEYQSTATQLGALARLEAGERRSAEEFEKSAAGQILAKFLGDKTAGVLTSYVGKVGLALSGGGFRASLFHIGVLAKLAEFDVLRRVEAISCVSGGSILGAHYYLELRKLFKEKEDQEITRDDYIELVKRLERDFLAGVQQNIRTRVAAEFITNLKMIFLPSYSRTMRAGELYERCLYRRVDDGQSTDPRWLTDLYIEPKGEDAATFRPKDDNWRRTAKVPDLILNATTLNTGHNWQFTASWMGEPPGSIDTEVDGNYRLRRMYYWEAPRKFRRVRLGYAVGASACVPGLFEPLSFKNLYPGLTVRLVDGGVHDNQGIVGLLEQDCNVLLVSDASGQMETQDVPSSGFLGVPLRSNSILMNRVRAAEYDDLAARTRSGLLRGLMFIHLKKDLAVDPVDWAECEDPHEASDEARPSAVRGPLTRYGIRKEVQRRLAAIRTDLDSFSDAEAFALMTSGYRMTEQAFRDEESLQGFPMHEGEPQNWRFLVIEDPMRRLERSGKLMKLLDVASQRGFKIWRLSTPLKILAWILGIAAAAGSVWLFSRFWSRPLVTVGTIGAALGAAVATAIFGKWVVRIVQFRSTLTKIGIGVGLSILGPLLVRFHLWIFDKLYLRSGKVNRVV